MLKLAISLVLFAIVLGLTGTAFAALVAIDVLRVIASYVISLVAFLLENWVIQAAFAAWVAFQLQEIGLANGRKRERLQAAYQRKVEAAKALYSLIEKRIYASRRYLAVLEEERDKIPEERDRYRAAVTDWNEQAQLNQVTLLLEFDSYFGLLVDHDYNPTFMKIDALLRKQRLLVEGDSGPSKPRSREVREMLDRLNRLSLDVFREMLKEARKDRNIMDEKVDISEENIDHISYGRLLKSLLQPSA